MTKYLKSEIMKKILQISFVRDFGEGESIFNKAMMRIMTRDVAAKFTWDGTDKKHRSRLYI